MKILQPKTNMTVYPLWVSTLKTHCIYSSRSRIKCEVIILTQKRLFIYSLFRRNARHIGEYLVIYVYLCANWSENWRTEGSEGAANAVHCESTKGSCLQSHSVLVCKQMCCHEALSSVLQCWSAVRWTLCLCLPLFPHTDLALFTKLSGVQRSFTCIHIHCKLIYKSMFTLRVKAKWSSDLLLFQLWVKLHLLEKDIKQRCVCFSLLLQSHHPTLVHSF